MSPSQHCYAAVNHSHLPTLRESVTSSKIPAQGSGWVCNTPSYGLMGQSSSTPNTWVYSQKVRASMTKIQSHFRRTRGHSSLASTLSAYFMTLGGSEMPGNGGHQGSHFLLCHLEALWRPCAVKGTEFK